MQAVNGAFVETGQRASLPGRGVGIYLAQAAMLLACRAMPRVASGG